MLQSLFSLPLSGRNPVRGYGTTGGGSAGAARLPAASAGFRAFDLNQPMKPSIELVCNPGIWTRVEVESNEQLPPRQDRACLEVDSGGSASRDGMIVSEVGVSATAPAR